MHLIRIFFLDLSGLLKTKFNTEHTLPEFCKYFFAALWYSLWDNFVDSESLLLQVLISKNWLSNEWTSKQLLLKLKVLLPIDLIDGIEEQEATKRIRNIYWYFFTK